MKYVIRPAGEADLDELLFLMDEHAKFEKAAFFPGGKKERFRQALFADQPRFYCWVVEFENGLQGYASYTFDYSTWEAADFLYMDCLFLRPACRGLGIGSEILSRLKSIARIQNCVCIQWQTPSFNTSAIDFYHKNKAISTEKVRFRLSV